MPGGPGGDWELSPACRKIKQELGKQSINTVRAQVPTRWGGREGWGEGCTTHSHSSISRALCFIGNLVQKLQLRMCVLCFCVCQALTAFERMMADPVV